MRTCDILLHVEDAPLKRSPPKDDMKPLNIYLSKEDKIRLNEIRKKYKLSYSTIADILSTAYPLMFGDTKVLEETYIYGREKYKTSIKPRACCYEVKKLTVFYSNILILYIRKETAKWLKAFNKWDEKKYMRLMSQIDRELNTRYDPNWDGDNFIRRTAKVVKQNPDYFRRLIGE